MLTSITLKDYTTFINETTFDFRKTEYQTLEKTNVANNVLKGALFVGENGSGKTQVLKAITLLLDILLGNNSINISDLKSFYTKGNTFSLTFTFQVDNKEIKYYIEFSGKEITIEKLYLDSSLVIDRQKEKGIITIAEKREVAISSNLSLLKQEYYKTNLDNEPTLIKWFEYLSNSIYVNCLTGKTRVYNVSNLTEQVLESHIEKFGTKEINSFLDNLNYNSEVVYDKNFNNENNKIISENNMIGLRKKGTNVTIPINLESTGNKCLLNVITPLKYAVKTNCILIIDGFSSGLHNSLEEALLKYFFVNSKESQIFIVSHSTNLLDTYLLRPDQMFSFSFDVKKGTQITRFSDLLPKDYQNFEKLYLNGVFNGLPKYDK